MPSNNNTNGNSGIINKRVTRRDALRAVGGAAVATIGVTGTVAAQTDTTSLDGSGTQDDPYVIDSVEGLDAVREDLTAHYRLAADIDVSTIDNWDPIGEYDSAADTYTGLTGALDGAGYTVNGLTIERPESEGAALFAYVHDGGEIRDVTLSNADVEGLDYAGAAAGYAWEANINNVTLENVTVTGREQVGGLAGEVTDTDIQTVCATGVTITPNDTHAGDHGGIVGALNDTSSTLRDAFIDATIEPQDGVDGASIVGGAAGRVGGLIDTVQTDVTVTGESKVGGIAGTHDGTMEHVSSVGAVEGTSWVGGIAGRTKVTGDESRISDAYSWCDVTGGGDVGGVTGIAANVAIERAYHAAGTVADDENIGGAVGSVGSSPVTLSGLYFEEGAVSGDPNDGDLAGVTSVSTDALTGTDAASTLSAFDFGSVWETVSGDYPVLSSTPSRSCAPVEETTTTTEDAPSAGAVASSNQSPLRFLPWGAALLVLLGMINDKDGDEQ